MSPVPPTDEEAAPPMETSNGDAAAATKPATTFPEKAAAADGTDAVPTTPAPTKVDAYKARGIRSKQSPVAITHVLLRFLTAVFALIAFAVIASDSKTFVVYVGVFSYISETVHFNDLFYFSYLLTANVLAFAYAIVTLVLSVVFLARGTVPNALFIGMFVLDQLLSYLLMSASTSAATGIRAQRPYLRAFGVSSPFFSAAYAAIAFSFLAFFCLAAAALISGFRVARRGRAV